MARLNYRHLHYFWRVASEGNLTRTAEHLHVSQSALSSQIRQLEESAGQPLFDRQGRTLTLNAAGRQVLEYANDIFARGEALEALFERGMAPDTQWLRIGMLSTLSRNFIDRLVAPLMSQAQLRFSLFAGSLDELLTLLGRHQLDVVLTNADVRGIDEQTWQSHLLARQPVSIVGPASLRPDTPFPEGYEQLRWVLPSRDHEIRRSFEGLCTRAAFAPDIQAEANDMAMLRLLARDSWAAAVLPSVVVRDELRQRVLVEYRTLPEVYESFYAITVRSAYRSEALATLLAGAALPLGADAPPQAEQRPR